MADETLGSLIDNRINHLINQQPVNLEGKIIKVYEDGFVDVETVNGRLTYVKCIGPASPNSNGVIVFLNGDVNNPVFILNDLSDYYNKSEIDELISDIISGDIDLKDYVRKADLINNTEYDVDLNLSFGTRGFDDTITIDMDIVDHVVSKIIRI